MNIVITGGAGFVGSNIARFLRRQSAKIQITAFDNLYRRGSERNLPLLQQDGIKFVHGDVRQKTDLALLPKADIVIECSAEPSVLAGYGESPEYLIDTNMIGALNCLELCRVNGSKLIFLSSSRIYPYDAIQRIPLNQTDSRFEWDIDAAAIEGITPLGLSEAFPLEGLRSLYGATKLSAELFCREYAEVYELDCIINRCGVIAGPGQFGKSDQGLIAFWLKQHLAKAELSYIGFGGSGKQVRDILDISDLCTLIWKQISDTTYSPAEIYNVGGGLENSLSLVELTAWCEKLTGNRLELKSLKDQRPADIPLYISDNTRIERRYSWRQARTVSDTLDETCKWLMRNEF